ncbi:MAG: M24 family metallopeptidase [Verrucomicrobiota bacterium]|nr:M24 family metallopeptidase [Verrucomicrobiota bacterium]
MDSQLRQAQSYLQERHLDGWLLYDFHRTNDLAHAFLRIPPKQLVTRRFFYWIPTHGAPIKIVHAIEPHMLDAWPGEKKIYSSWKLLESVLASVLQGHKKVAMEYSPRAAIPYVSKVDGGTIDLVRSFGIEVVSSADFLLYFTSVLDQEQIESHCRAALALQEIVEEGWDWIGKRFQEGVSERDVQNWIEKQYKKRRLITDSPPIIAINEHSADPHFKTAITGSTVLRPGDLILIDLWAKEEGERAVFGDITRVAIAGQPSDPQQKVFHAVRGAQKAAIDLVRSRFKVKQPIQGWEVDEAAREFIRKAGFGDFFIHRTGHNIEVHLHGSGTHMDNLEMHDVRPLLPGTCFSIEPGIYLPGEFGIRLETDVLIQPDGEVLVTGGEQEELRLLFH